MNNNGDQLKALRGQIDALDERILELLAERVAKVRAVGHYKQEHGLPLLDEDRWQAVIESRSAQGEEFGLSSDFVAELYDVIHQYALEVEAQETDLT